MSRRLRILTVCTHPVQYSAPMFRHLAQRPELDSQVVYCRMPGEQPQVDPGFGIDVKWDVPLLEGYTWVSLPNRSPVSNADSFFGLVNPGIWELISEGKFDAVVLFTGYVCATFWIALAAAKWHRIPVLFGTDAHELAPRDHKVWKLWIKRWLWPTLFGLADLVLAPSSGTVALMRSLGIPDDHITMMPYCVDNDWWIEQSDKVDRRAVRERWNVPDDAVAVLFCAKLQQWKRPQDLLRAFAQVADVNAYLVFVGDGPLRSALESEAGLLGIAEKLRFLGFVNQTGLPEIYTASDVFVLPSEHEPFGVVVNEAMLCQCPVIVSDRVGAGFDLVRDSETGFVFAMGDVTDLADTLRRAMSDRVRLRRMGEASRLRMAHWSPDDSIAAFVQAFIRVTRIHAE
ncbi:MAG: glycosyltransferase family 4 protein [Candidatus Acidiferrales bacterium]